MGKKVGINQRISIKVMEMGMKAALDDMLTSEFAEDLAAGEYQGANRITKARSIIGKLTQRNPLFPYVQEHRKEYMTAIKYKADRAMVFASLINAAYVFGYDATVILGKIFHVQDEVTSQLILNRLGAIYASNRSLPNALYCIMPMYIEAGFIERPKTGTYAKCELEPVTSFAKDIYKKSFFVNNPMLVEEDCDCSEHPYFEFF